MSSFYAVPGGAFVRRPGAPRHMTILDRFDALIERSRQLARQR
jgi:hypothetical protein